MPRSREPFLWALFSGGGMLGALLLPALTLVLLLAAPLGWATVPHERLAALALHPLGRLACLAVITLSVFHWAHRFRYTLYDGLQLYHLHHLIAVATYGAATLLSLFAAYVMVTM